MHVTKAGLLEIVGLQTPRGRLAFFGIASLLIFVAPYSWLAHLSLWQHLGLPAPSIGLTRAYWQVLHLHFAAAWQRNHLIYVVLALGLPLLAWDAVKVWRRFKSR
jgi:hypothetical protein